MSKVTATPAASPAEALAHFGAEFTFETDCSDVHAAYREGGYDFVLIDARTHELYDRGHVPGAVSLPHGKIALSTLAPYPEGALFVVYCAGPHCNGAARAALKLAKFGRPVKLMAGGVAGWLDEGYELERSAAPAAKAGA